MSNQSMFGAWLMTVDRPMIDHYFADGVPLCGELAIPAGARPYHRGRPGIVLGIDVRHRCARCKKLNEAKWAEAYSSK